MTLTKELFWKFVRFGVVGFSGMIVDYGFLFLFVKVCGLPDLLANAFSFTLAATSNYFLNRVWTFHSQEKQVGREYMKFFLVSLVGLGINTLTIYIFELFIPEWKANTGHGFHFIIFIEYFYVLKFIAIVITTLWNFCGNLLFTFRQKPATDKE